MCNSFCVVVIDTVAYKTSIRLYWEFNGVIWLAKMLTPLKQIFFVRYSIFTFKSGKKNVAMLPIKTKKIFSCTFLLADTSRLEIIVFS